MKSVQSLGLKTPILFVNPPINPDSALIEEVFLSGGLGIVDHVTAGPARFTVRRGVLHGVRVFLEDLPKLEFNPDICLIVIPYDDAPKLSTMLPGELAKYPVPVCIEVGSHADVREAERAGAVCLIARANEGPGWVSQTTGFVLFQEIRKSTELPVFLQGGVSLRSAAGVAAAGGAGVVLDVHLLLCKSSTVSDLIKDFLISLRTPATGVLAEELGRPLRIYSRIGTSAVRQFIKMESELKPGEEAEYLAKLRQALLKEPTSPDTGHFLLPLSEDFIIEREVLQSLGSAADIVREFGMRMDISSQIWPLGSDSPVCSLHETRFPLVQGPMAHVSDTPAFLRAVAESGAFPFLALGNMPEQIAKDAIHEAARETGGNFGVGLIGLDANRHCYEKHLSIMRETPPRSCILAAGSVELAETIEQQGTICYLHCPSSAVLSEAIKAGLRHFVWEGCESGGHIGMLSSLNLWSACLNAIAEEQKQGLDVGEILALFAGGIGSPVGAAFVGGMVADLAAKGLKVGLQIGTAYLASREAVTTGAITPTYQQLALQNDRTVVIGKTVNTRARAANSPMTEQLTAREWERARDGISLSERKELYEKDNLGALRLASKGCAIDPETASSECPVFCQLSPEQQIERGLFLMGQAVSLLDQAKDLSEINEDIIVQGETVFEKSKKAVVHRYTEPETDRTENTLEVYHEKEPIAVVGIGLRFPGSSTPAAFWDQILSGRSGICPVPDERWGKVEFYYDPNPAAVDKSYTRIGGFISDFSFDPLKYRIPPSVVQKMDRTQQLSVVCAGDALEDAGLSPEKLQGIRVGVMIGNSMGGENTDRYAQRVGLPRAMQCLDQSVEQLDLSPDEKEKIRGSFRSRFLDGLPEITEDSLPGELANVISGRVANVFNLQGPNFTVDAACASSMAAVMSAVRALRDGAIDYAITGGVDAAMSPASFIKFCKIGALSPDGSRPFDKSANGFVMGEGAGMMVLKRLSDAVRDRDRIYGTILDLGSSSDGRGKGITAPNPVGQTTAVVECYRSTGIDPRTVQLIEGHGTSTAVGDKTELEVLDAFFREAGMPPNSVGVGSVKSQIGHLKAAAGAAGIIKALLSLYHRILPPTANVKNPNPCIEWDSSPLFILHERKSWKRSNGFPRRVGVSAFGFGGTNFHALLQEYSPELRVLTGGKKTTAEKSFIPPRWHKPEKMSIAGEAWVVGATDSNEFADKANKILESLDDENFSEIASSYRQEAMQKEIRCGFAAKDSESAKTKIRFVLETIKDPSKKQILLTKGIHMVLDASRNKPGAVACLFPGQGSQYPFMLRDLAQRFSIVADTFLEADRVLDGLGLPAVTSLLFPDPSVQGDSESNLADPLKDTQILQPMILTADTAIFRLLQLMGLRPVAVSGHSLGEYAACVASGVFTFKDALEAVSVRGREMARVSIADPGLMMSIPADARVVEDVLARVEGYVVAANKNSPKQTVISGETEAVKKAGELFLSMGLEGVLIPVSAAFHSGVVAPARDPFMKTLQKLPVHSPEIPILSNVTGEFYPVGPSAADRIRDLLGKQFAAPVEWVKSLRRLQRQGATIFLECGPKRVLTNFTVDTLGKDVFAWPTNHPKKGGVMQLLETVAALMAEGIELDPRAGEGRFTIPDAGFSRAKARVEDPISANLSHQQARESAISSEDALGGLLDAEIRAIAGKPEFRDYLDLQGDFVRSMIKSGFKSFSEKVLPLQKTVKKVESEGFDFCPIVVSGISAGLPHDVRFPFEKETLDDLIAGRNFIKRVPDDSQRSICQKNVERLIKGPSGEAQLELVQDTDDVIKLAGFFGDEPVIDEYGIEDRMIRAMDITTRLAVAAGIEALRDAGIPLMRLKRQTTTGHELPESWALPPALRKETGVIFASAFPGTASLIDEVTREVASRYGSGARNRLIDFYAGMLEGITAPSERERISQWFSKEFGELSPSNTGDLFKFNRNFLFRVMSMAHGQFAQIIRAQGPNTHVNAACAGTTQAILIARDWIRTGQASRVVVIAADDAAGQSLLPWIGSGFLAMGAATVKGNVKEAALPFDKRRHGLIVGSAAVGLVLEKADLTKKRGMDAIVSVEAGVVANSGFHGTRLDVEHICSTMEKMITRWEYQSGIPRTDLAGDVFFMSHETYSPRRGGSSAAEIAALRKTFGQYAKKIPIANTKGFTGHTMGVGVEDVVSMRCLQKGLLPPIPNLQQPDPDFADMSLSLGGAHNAHYALRLAAGFGSQIAMALYRVISKEENRLSDMMAHRNWLKEITGYEDPIIKVEQRTLRVMERQEPASAAFPAIASETKEHQSQVTLSVTSGDRSLPVRVRENLMTLLSEKTGYPVEMLDTNLDLEADLGIDTVKQAEFISEVRSMYGIPRIEGLKIAEYPTIDHIIQFVVSHLSSSTPDESSSTAVQLHTDLDKIRNDIIELLSQKTGYPGEMLSPDLDLEADLGIDTVKQAEFIAELRKKYDIPRIEGLKIADFPTINHLVTFVEKSISGEKSHRIEAIENQGINGDFPSRGHARDGAMVKVYETRLMNIHVEGESTPVQVDEVVIVGGDLKTQRIFQSKLGDLLAVHTSTVDSPEGLVQSQNRKMGIVNLLGLSEKSDSVSKTFELYRTVAREFDEGPVFLVAVVSQDGALGFEAPTASGYESGTICGATKAFSHEYPQSIVRVIDFHPNIDAQSRANFIPLVLGHNCPMETCVGEHGEIRVVRLTPRIGDRPRQVSVDGDVILITGGARGIAAACAQFLARIRPYTFVLFGRTQLTRRAEKMSRFDDAQWEEEKGRLMDRLRRQGAALTPVLVEKEFAHLKAEAEVFRNVSRLRALGSEVVYRTVDMVDRVLVSEMVRDVSEICGRIDVVIHAAGIDASKALRSKTLEQMMNVFEVKVNGMKNILNALELHLMAPRQIIGFGSVAGRFGNKAQVDYAGANDGLAHLLRWIDSQSDIKTTTIAWAPWSQIGMAARGTVQKALDSAGIDFIPPEEGARILAEEMEILGKGSEIVAAGNLGPFAGAAFGSPNEPSIEYQTLPAFKWGGQDVVIDQEVAGEYLKARVMLDPAHPLLAHHRIDRAYVLPGVGGLEIMGSAVSYIHSDTTPLSFENVEFLSPIKLFKDEVFEAEIEVTRKKKPGEEHLFRAQISSWITDKKGKKVGLQRIHHRADITAVTPRVPQTETPIKVNESIFLSCSDIYDVFFHGPAFHFLDYVSLHEASGSVEFRFKNSVDEASMFRSHVPAAVESCFQASAAYCMETQHIMALPVGVHRIEVYSQDLCPHTGRLTLTAVTKDDTTGRRRFQFDGQMSDSQGQIILQLTGITMVEIPGGRCFSARVAESIFSTNELLASVSKNHEESGELTEDEFEECKAHATEKRTNEWLAGRLALKRTVGRLLQKSGAPVRSLKHILIRQDEMGKPVVELRDDPGKPLCDVSLSHSNGLVVAAASELETFRGLGIDIEKIEPRSEAWVEDYFTEQEKQMALASDDKWAYLTALWCIKEAALKATGLGLRVDLQEVCIKSVEESGRAVVEFRNGSYKLLKMDPARVEARVEVHDGIAMARVIMRNERS